MKKYILYFLLPLSAIISSCSDDSDDSDINVNMLPKSMTILYSREENSVKTKEFNVVLNFEYNGANRMSAINYQVSDGGNGNKRISGSEVFNYEGGTRLISVSDIYRLDGNNTTYSDLYVYDYNRIGNDEVITKTEQANSSLWTEYYVSKNYVIKERPNSITDINDSYWEGALFYFDENLTSKTYSEQGSASSNSLKFYYDDRNHWLDELEISPSQMYLLADWIPFSGYTNENNILREVSTGDLEWERLLSDVRYVGDGYLKSFTCEETGSYNDSNPASIQDDFMSNLINKIDSDNKNIEPSSLVQYKDKYKVTITY